MSNTLTRLLFHLLWTSAAFGVLFFVVLDWPRLTKMEQYRPLVMKYEKERFEDAVRRWESMQNKLQVVEEDAGTAQARFDSLFRLRDSVEKAMVRSVASANLGSAVWLRAPDGNLRGFILDAFTMEEGREQVRLHEKHGNARKVKLSQMGSFSHWVYLDSVSVWSMPSKRERGRYRMNKQLDSAYPLSLACRTTWIQNDSAGIEIFRKPGCPDLGPYMHSIEGDSLLLITALPSDEPLMEGYTFAKGYGHVPRR